MRKAILAHIGYPPSTPTGSVWGLLPTETQGISHKETQALSVPPDNLVGGVL